MSRYGFHGEGYTTTLPMAWQRDTVGHRKRAGTSLNEDCNISQGGLEDA